MSTSKRPLIDLHLDELYAKEKIFRDNMKSFHDAIVDGIRDYGIEKFSEDERKILSRLEFTLAGLKENALGDDPAESQIEFQLSKIKNKEKEEPKIGPISLEEREELEKRAQEREKESFEIRKNRMEAITKFLTKDFFIQKTMLSTASLDMETFNIFLLSMKNSHPAFYEKILSQYQTYIKSHGQISPLADKSVMEFQSLTIMPIQRGPRYDLAFNEINKSIEATLSQQLAVPETLETVKNNILEMDISLAPKTGYMAVQKLINQLLLQLMALKGDKKYANKPQVEKVYNQILAINYDLALKRNTDYENIFNALQNAVQKLEPALKKADFTKTVDLIQASDLKNVVISNQWKNLYDAVQNTIKECEENYSRKLKLKSDDKRAKQITDLLTNLKPALAKLNPEPDTRRMSDKEQKDVLKKRYEAPDAKSYKKMLEILDSLHTARTAYGPLFNIHEDHFSMEVGKLFKEQNSAAKDLIQKNGPLSLSKHESKEVKPKANVIKPRKTEEEGDTGREKPHR